MSPALERTARRINDNPLLTALQRIAVPLLTIVVSISLTVGGWYLTAQANAAQKVDDRVTAVESVVTSTVSDVRVLQNTIVNKSSARDQQIATVVSQVSTLSTKVEKFADQSGQLLAAISALNARLDEADRAAARH